MLVRCLFSFAGSRACTHNRAPFAVRLFIQPHRWIHHFFQAHISLATFPDRGRALQFLLSCGASQKPTRGGRYLQYFIFFSSVPAAAILAGLRNKQTDYACTILRCSLSLSVTHRRAYFFVSCLAKINAWRSFFFFFNVPAAAIPTGLRRSESHGSEGQARRPQKDRSRWG